MATKLYSTIANAILVLKSTKGPLAGLFTNSALQYQEEVLECIEEDFLPYGSGFDAGCKISLEDSSHDKIVITSAYHKLNEYGYYEGWIDLIVTVTPSLILDFVLTIDGEGIDDLDREYLQDEFGNALGQLVTLYLDDGIMRVRKAS